MKRKEVNMKREKKARYLAVLIEPSLYKQIESAAASYGWTISQMTRELLKAALRKPLFISTGEMQPRG
jgi:hypothetical protein